MNPEFVWDDEFKVVELDSSDVHNTVNVLNATDLSNDKFGYVYFTIINFKMIMYLKGPYLIW